MTNAQRRTNVEVLSSAHFRSATGGRGTAVFGKLQRAAPPRSPNWSSLPVADLLQSGVSTHLRSARGRPEGFQTHVERSCASRRTEFARPSRSDRFWGRGGRRTWRSSL